MVMALGTKEDAVLLGFTQKQHLTEFIKTEPELYGRLCSIYEKGMKTTREELNNAMKGFDVTRFMKEFNEKKSLERKRRKILEEEQNVIVRNEYVQSEISKSLHSNTSSWVKHLPVTHHQLQDSQSCDDDSIVFVTEGKWTTKRKLIPDFQNDPSFEPFMEKPIVVEDTKDCLEPISIDDTESVTKFSEFSGINDNVDSAVDLMYLFNPKAEPDETSYIGREKTLRMIIETKDNEIKRLKQIIQEKDDTIAKLMKSIFK